MLQMLIEAVIVISAIVSGSILVKRNPLKSQKVFAITFVLSLAVFIGFSVAEVENILGIVNLSISYSPLKILSMLCFIYWVSLLTSKTEMFDKVIGE